MAKYLLLHNIQGYSIQENQQKNLDNQDTNSKSEEVDKTNKVKKNCAKWNRHSQLNLELGQEVTK